MTKFHKSIRLAGSFLLMILMCGLAAAQERGQYLPGFRGLNGTGQPHPGFTYANYFIWYPADKLKDREGDNSRIDHSLNFIADVNIFAYAAKTKVLGGTYAVTAAIPIANTAVTLPLLSTGGPGLGDVYIEPVSLGWTFSKGNLRAAYGFVAPTGRYELGAPDNTSSDFWGHEITFGGTVNPDTKKVWQVSMSSVWELHQKKRHSDVRVGHNVTFEYGVGKTFIKNEGKQLLQLGLVGYSQFQLVGDSGRDVVPLTAGDKDRTFALGPEFGVILPQKMFHGLVRVLPEFSSRSRTQGVTLVISLGKSF
jgi:hypothetical protein